MSTLRLETYSPINKPKSTMGLFWDRLTSTHVEPPYKRLPEYHIRVAKIKPGTTKYPLRVKLKVVDPRKAKYTALSYAWESDTEDSDNDSPGPTQSHTILCGGTPLRVTKNLYDALCQIRDVQSDVPVFIDALCINFNNNLERTEMINIMGHIYSRAASVIVWLGKKQASSDETILTMRKLVNAIDWRKIGDPNSYNFRDSQFFTQIGMEPLTIAQWRNIHRFCHLKWFTRYWAFFELAWAKSAIFLYGDTCMDYDFLIDFGMILGLSGWLKSLSQISNEGLDEPSVGLTKMLGPVARLRITPPWHPKHADHVLWMRDNYGLQNETERAWKFFEILIQSAEAFECRDPRDKIYAPLAMARMVFAGQPLNKQWPTPGYDQSIDVVYKQFSDLIVRYTHEPSILATAVSAPPPRTTSRQPYSRQVESRMPLE